MDKKSFTQLVRKYLRGNATEEERRWLDEYDHRISETPVPELSKDDADKLENELAGRIRAKIGETNRNNARPLATPLLKAAALIALVAGLAWILVVNGNTWFENNAAENYSEVNVPFGQIKKLKLEDGTQVTLNAGSHFRYPAHFSDNEQKVWLRGEGYFDVAKQNGKVFKVETGKLSITVLGTRFNVNAYPESNLSRISVVEGKVAVEDLDKKNIKLTLLAGDNADYQTLTSSLTKNTVSGANALAWQNGELDFKNETFKSVARSLERRYAIQISVDTPIENCRIYARFGNDPAEKVLEVLAVLMQAKLSGSGKVFRFSGEQCP